mgnify:FL=1
MIQVLQRAHILLESIAEVPEKIWSIKELAALIHVSAPTCCNIVETLVQLDLIQCLGKRKGYCAGTKLLQLSLGYTQKNFLAINKMFLNFEQKYPFPMEQIRYNCGYRIIERQISPQNPLFVQYNRLVADDILVTLSGKMVLSHQNEKERIRFFHEKQQQEKLVINKCAVDLWPTTPSLDDFLAETEKTRKKSYLERNIAGTHQLAFPVYNSQNQFDSAIATCCPSYCYSSELKENILHSFYEIASALRQ